LSKAGTSYQLMRLADLREGEARVVDVRDGEALHSMLVARRGGEIRVFRNRCPHAGMPLERLDGRVIFQEAAYLVCAAHFASFRFADGGCVGGPAKAPLASVASDVVDGWLVVTL
jgi:nitrite reductase/ring-hydroxylating ferredoxin subunit